MVRLKIDNRNVEIKEGTTILEAAKSVGILIPHFCYHPSLSIPGNCRICSVEVVGQGKPVISCREKVAEGMEVFTDSPMVKEIRKSVLEFILINHPLDCPRCDKSGECVLQDYYYEYSLKPSEFREEKVLKPKAVHLGPNIILDAERCIECGRCVRFLSEITKTNELAIRERSDHSTIDIFPGKELNNSYSLCTVDLCPVGALTSIDFRFKKRVWFLESTPSICNGCSTGCNIFIDHHDGIVYRYRPRYNEGVNDYWMCDAGRLSYKQINSNERILNPLILVNNDLERALWDEALSYAAGLIKELMPEEIAGVLSAQATVEESEAFNEFLKDFIKTPNIYLSGLDEDPAFKDDFLKEKDRNPNMTGVLEFTKERLKGNLKYKGYIILDGLTSDELMRVVSSRPKWVILIASYYDSKRRFPDVVLPKVTFAEQDGTFINKKGVSQEIKRSIAPVGESYLLEDIIKGLKEKL